MPGLYFRSWLACLHLRSAWPVLPVTWLACLHLRSAWPVLPVTWLACLHLRSAWPVLPVTWLACLHLRSAWPVLPLRGPCDCSVSGVVPLLASVTLSSSQTGMRELALPERRDLFRRSWRIHLRLPFRVQRRPL